MHMTTPDISVVLATYNGARFLRTQIESILAQSLPPKEIIVVDDASTDDTVTILKSYALSDQRFTIICNDENLGYIRNFEKGMMKAGCNLVALSDQDDIWLPHKLATLYSHLNNQLLVYSNSELIDLDGNKLNLKMSDIKKPGSLQQLPYVYHWRMGARPCYVVQENVNCQMPPFSLPNHTRFLAWICCNLL